MSDVTIVIPNYNGISFLDACLRSVSEQIEVSTEVIVVDNASSDGSQEFIQKNFPSVQLCCLDKNYGFCRAVNEGIKLANSPYVILLNNDTEVCPDFVLHLWKAIKKDSNRFSCAAKMLQYQNRTLLDNAGDFYCAFGWGLARGKGKPSHTYDKGEEVFSACGGAAIYRRDLLLELGGFDEAHFAYLEDMDISYRAKIHGYKIWYEPKAEVFHIGSATSGSRYNRFKVLHSAGNNIYLIYKNMPFLQMLLNIPFLSLGFFIKYLFFVRKGFGKDYIEGLQRGFRLCREHPEKKVMFQKKHLRFYGNIQLELWKNMLLFLPNLSDGR